MDPKENRPHQYFIDSAWELLKVTALLGNLALLTQSNISLGAYWEKVSTFYDSLLVQHYAALLQYLSHRFDFDLARLPAWLPAYLPIATAFFIGFLSALAQVDRKSEFMLLKEFLQDMIQQGKEWPEAIFQGILMLLVAVAIGLVVFVISPVAVILFPVLVVALMILAVAIYAALLFALLKLAIYWVLPALGVLATAVSLVMLLFFRAKYFEVLHKLRRAFVVLTPYFFRKNWERLRNAFARLRASFRGALMEFFTETTTQFDYLWRLLVFQYRATGILALGFLILTAIHHSLAA